MGMLSALGALVRRLGAAAARQAPAPDPAPPPEAAPGPHVDFLCNVCGNENRGVALAHAENRECASCRHCGSSLRMRSLVHELALELYGAPRTLPEFPTDKSIRGLGMSDWDGYAVPLAEKLDYVNTHFHKAPRMDITAVPPDWHGRYRFLVSSDVFEHIPLAGLDAAFANSRALLAPGGSFILTVPFFHIPETVEHFPRLHDFRIEEREGRRVLVNRTREGDVETFEALEFHGGEGMTLEMRKFSEADLLARLDAAGFSSVRVCSGHYPAYGILWPMSWAVPVVARA